MVTMSARMNQRVVRRPNLPITAKDEAGIDLIRSSPQHRRALDLLAPTTPSLGGNVGESVLLHAIFEAGINAVLRSAEEDGYAEMAAQRSDEDQRSAARRRTPSWAHEA